MKRIAILAVAAFSMLTACKKLKFDKEVTGEALTGFRLLTPANNTNLVLNAAIPSTKVDITWNAATPGVGTLPAYTWIAALKTGTLDAPLLSFPANGSGKTTALSLTYQQIDDALKAKGIADGAAADLIWSVSATNGTTTVRSSDVFNIKITRFQDGATPFILLGPASSTTNLEINPSSTTDNFVFNWTKSIPAKTASTIKYRVWFYKDDATQAAVFSAPSNNSGSDSLLTMSWKAMNDSLDKYGYTDPGTAAKLKWRVAATSGGWSQWSDYINQISIVRLVRMYLVGSITGWDINNPWEVIADKAAGRQGKIFYTYVKLNPGDAFKFAKEKGNWGSAYGTTGGTGGIYTTGYNQGGDVTVTTAGTYRVTLDLTANKIYVQEKQPGIVGNMQGWNPGSPTLGGMYGTAGKYKFLVVTGSAVNEEFKFHDGPVWDNGSADKARWWGLGTAAGLLDVDGNGANLKAPAAPRTRAIWDGTDPQNVKYDLSPAVEMRVVGDGIQGAAVDWDPPTSPQMTYAGNGKWTITMALKAGKSIKFLAGNAWGAFDYEDVGDNGSVPGQVKRKIHFDNPSGTNFSTPAAAGTYTITLDEHAGTVNIQ